MIESQERPRNPTVSIVWPASKEPIGNLLNQLWEAESKRDSKFDKSFRYSPSSFVYNLGHPKRELERFPLILEFQTLRPVRGKHATATISTISLLETIVSAAKRFLEPSMQLRKEQQGGFETLCELQERIRKRGDSDKIILTLFRPFKYSAAYEIEAISFQKKKPLLETLQRQFRGF